MLLLLFVVVFGCLSCFRWCALLEILLGFLNRLSDFCCLDFFAAFEVPPGCLMLC